MIYLNTKKCVWYSNVLWSTVNFVEWKQAAVTPVLKKGSPEQLENYRPVSCLPAASKVLEIVICSQLSNYLETNDLLPCMLIFSVALSNFLVYKS